MSPGIDEKVSDLYVFFQIYVSIFTPAAQIALL